MMPFFSRRRRREQDLDEELRTHLRMAVEERVTRGESRADAERAALREFGDVGRVKEVTRTMWGGVWLDRLVQDLVFGVRSLRRDPGFALVAVLTISLGVGITTAMFTVVNGVLIQPLPFHESERLVTLSVGSPERVVEGNGVRKRDFPELRERSSPFSLVTAYLNYPPVTLTGAGEPARLRAAFVTAEFHEVLGVQPALGAGFDVGDDRLGSSPVVVLGNALWRSRFGADPGVVGKSAVIEGISRTVVGVMPPGFDFPDHRDVWLPWSASPYADLGPGTSIDQYVIGRLAEDVTLERAAAELDAWAGELERADQVAVVTPLMDVVVGDSRYPLLLFMGAVGLVLLISCTNVGNLLLMRAGSRELEIGLRRALGAGRGRLLRQLLTESVTLALLGGGFGILVALGGVELLLSIAPPGTIPRGQEIGIDLTVLVFALTVSTLTGVAFGLVPALKATGRDLTSAIKAGARTHTSRAKFARDALVVAEVALAVVLLTGAGLLVRSFQQIRSIDLGFSPESTLTISVDLPRRSYADAEAAVAMHLRVLDGLGEIPGVAAAGASNFEPFGPIAQSTNVRIEDMAPRSDGYNGMVGRSLVSDGYFRAMGVTMLSGRDFTAEDDLSGRPVAMINRSMAERFWPGLDPVGKRLSRDHVRGLDNWMTVVGVIEDVVRNNVAESRGPMLYLPLLQNDYPPDLVHMQYVVRTMSSRRSVADAMRSVLRDADPDLPIGSITTMDDVVVASIGDRLFETRILGTFAVLALLVAAVGVYGVTAYSVSERKREIGIRMALGARAEQVAGKTLGGVLRLAVFGLALGSVGGWAATRLIDASLYGVGPGDPMTLVGVALLLGAVVVAAALVPIWRATRVDPVEVLSA